ncbi:MAG: hypothetical protein A2Y23_13925 [Clostridiales bacterium GWB2_37_7]|nr:MAG: hypothetical protein A2Y23_13925 [Clostridiales bacterium GWB2_37_7]
MFNFFVQKPLITGLIGIFITISAVFMFGLFSNTILNTIVLLFGIIGLTLFLFSISYNNFRTFKSAFFFSFLASWLPYLVLTMIPLYFGKVIDSTTRSIFHALIVLFLLKGAVFNPRFNRLYKKSGR